ncbi:MAG TPA: pitrilysin family protein [Chthonomonadaceae bacterium]|nr:pitrilysin family protein [Chthonomonadaceae bacterium]
MLGSRIGLLTLLLMALAVGAGAQQTPRYPIETFTLPNGLRVVLSQDRSAPVIGLALTYDVGSRNEVKGRTGFAHLFEHMMFQGSAHVGKGEHPKLIGSNGGLVNGFTRSEATTYIETFPSEKLPLVLWLEADRMRSLAVTAENLKNQQEVVKEEKRLRYDNQPYTNARQGHLQKLAYQNFANQHTTIGLMEDLDAASLSDVQAFFKTYYAPNNAVLVLVGDFEPQVARRLITQSFGDIPRQPTPPRPDLTEPQQTAEKRESLTDPLARVPALVMAWHGPSLGDPDTYPLDLLAEILFSRESSRAYQALVKGRQMALSIQGGLDSQRGPSLFTLFAVYRPNVSAAEMEKAILDQIEAIQRTPPSAEELQRVKTRFRADQYRGGFTSGLESMLGRAVRIADDTVFQNDPNLINTEMERYMAVTPEQIQAVARKVFTPENRTVIEVRPGGAQAAPGKGGRPE